MSIVAELSNQKEDSKIMIALKSLENTQYLQTLRQKLKNSEFLLFLSADTLRESIFAGIIKTQSPQIETNDKTFL